MTQYAARYNFAGGEMGEHSGFTEILMANKGDGQLAFAVRDVEYGREAIQDVGAPLHDEAGQIVSIIAQALQSPLPPSPEPGFLRRFLQGLPIK
jgi:hypothetical protein